MPRQTQPDGVRLAYFQAITPIVREVDAPLRAVRSEILRLLAEERALDRGDARVDAGDRERRALEVVERAGRQSSTLFRPQAAHAVAEQFGRRTGQFQHEQIDRQVRQALGVPFSAIERPIADLVPVFAKANVELIRTIPVKYQDRLARDVREAFQSGMSVDALARKLADGEDASESDARRIARDQIGKLNAQFNQERQESLGVTGYVWRGANDNRERDNHRELEGRHFDWSDPPLGGGTTEDEEGHPGEGIQCRCWAEPDFSPIIGDLSGES
jgi:SPP1 gp7 family putative phage head morphogenesis protein